MEVLIGDAITIYHPSQDVKDFCRKNLIVENPDHFKKERMGLWTGNTPKHLYLYEKHTDMVVIPYGCRKQLRSMLDPYIRARARIDHEKVWMWDIYPDIKSFQVDYDSNIHTYDYQEEVVQAMLKAQNGIIVMPCGSGKTQTALETVARLGLRTLWLTHTQDLLNQSMERAKVCFGCDDSMFGTITEGKVNIGAGITFATVQTMCKLDLDRYRTQWAVVIVDECQHCCGSPTRVTQFYKVINNLYAPYKFGLTATPKRSDGLDKSMFALIGDKIIEIDKSRVAEKTCEVRVETIQTDYFPNDDYVLNGDGTINYGHLVTDLISDKDRLCCIMDAINKRCGCYTIVLANRIKYLKEMQDMYIGGRSICLSATNSKKAKQERKEALKKLNEGEINVIFATYQLAAEGLDCPNLRYIVFATPERNDRIITQAVGRVARKADGKEYGTVLDFVDGFGMYQGWYRKRCGYYKKLKCKMME